MTPAPSNPANDPNYIYFGGLTEKQRLANHVIQDALNKVSDEALTKAELRPYLDAIRQANDESLDAVIARRLSADQFLATMVAASIPAALPTTAAIRAPEFSVAPNTLPTQAEIGTIALAIERVYVFSSPTTIHVGDLLCASEHAIFVGYENCSFRTDQYPFNGGVAALGVFGGVIGVLANESQKRGVRDAVAEKARKLRRQQWGMTVRERLERAEWFITIAHDDITDVQIIPDSNGLSITTDKETFHFGAESFTELGSRFSDWRSGVASVQLDDKWRSCRWVAPLVLLERLASAADIQVSDDDLLSLASDRVYLRHIWDVYETLPRESRRAIRSNLAESQGPLCDAFTTLVAEKRCRGNKALLAALGCLAIALIAAIPGVHAIVRGTTDQPATGWEFVSVFALGGAVLAGIGFLSQWIHSVFVTHGGKNGGRS